MYELIHVVYKLQFIYYMNYIFIKVILIFKSEYIIQIIQEIQKEIGLTKLNIDIMEKSTNEYVERKLILLN